MRCAGPLCSLFRSVRHRRQSYYEDDDRSLPDLPAHWNLVRSNTRSGFHEIHYRSSISYSLSHRFWLRKCADFLGERLTHLLGGSRNEIKNRVRDTNLVRADSGSERLLHWLRLTHLFLQASLLLATVAKFCSAEPPTNSRILPYIKPISYCFLLVSTSLVFGGLILDPTPSPTIHAANPVWFREVCPSPHSRVIAFIKTIMG